jgi:transposase
MKNISNVVGIDVSKQKIDACIYAPGTTRCFTNDQNGFENMIYWVKSKAREDTFLICFENTGYYSLMLAVFLQQNNFMFSMITPLEIKRSIGLVRGKNDIIDAYQIARYGWLHREEIKQTVLAGKDILGLSQLLKVREQFVKQKGALQNMLAAFEQVKSLSEKKAIRLLKQQIIHLQKQIIDVETGIEQLLGLECFASNYKLLRSIKGVGLILAAQLIAHTNNFQSFERWRQFACYCGLAPFQYQSGSSIRGKTQVHPIADRKVKALLTMAAISAIQYDLQLKAYYKRKVEAGKSKMSVLNAVKCKLIARAFSVIQRQTPYVLLQAA